MKKQTPLEFESIRLDRMPGFPPHALFGVTKLEPGVTLITGPNMSGKTTLANAMSAVLWPSLADRKAEVTAVIRHEDSDWSLKIEDRSVQSCQRDGQASDPPELPSAEVSSRYHISLVDLLQLDSGPDQLAAQIARETAGGYDLPRAAAEVGATTSVPSHRKEVGALDSTHRTVKELKRGQEELERRETQLAALEEERLQAEQARVEMPRIEAAQELREGIREAAAAADELATFPAAMEHVTGSEEENLQSIRNKIDREREALAKCRQQHEAAAAEIAAIGLVDGGPSGDQIRSMRNQLQSLDALEDRVAQRAEERTRAAARVQETLAALGAPPSDDAPTLDSAGIAELENFAKEAERHAGLHQALKKQCSLLEAGMSETFEDVDRLSRGRNHLVGWLKTPTQAAASAPVSRGPFLAVTALLALSGLLLILLVHWGFLVLLAAGLAASAIALRGSARPSSTTRDHFEREFLATEVGRPTAWTVEAVGQLLVEIQEREALGRLQQERRVELRRVRADLAEAERALSALTEERHRLLESHGAAPPAERESGDAAFFFFVKLATEWRLARTAETEASAAVAEASAQALALGEELLKALAPFGYDTVGSAAKLQGALDDLADRRATLQRVTAELRAAEAQCKVHEERIADLEREVAELFAGLELPDGDEAGLRDLLRQLEAYAVNLTKRQDAEVRRATVAGRLERLGGNKELEELGDEDLARRLREAQAQEASWEHAVEQIADTKRQIAEAGGRTVLTDALAMEEEAREELRRCMDRDLDNVAAAVLVDHLNEQVRSRSRPPVFQRAAALFAEITAGKCRLDMEDGDHARFTVVETGDLRARDLSELSAGTRVQLLLAVRLAYVELQERGVALPLILDETLANSDEERALAIIEAMSTLAARGRQLFYFTAQHDEVAKWTAMSAQFGQKPPKMIDLATVRALERAREIPLPEPAKLPDEPLAPVEGEEHEAYGRRLGVSGIDPRVESVEGIHIWHLLDEPSVVHALLVRRAPTWGQLRVLHDAAGGDERLIDRPRMQRMRAAALAIEISAEQWRIGRGKPVTRAELRTSDAVSNSFIDAVSELAQTCGGEATKLIAALQDGSVSRFRSDKSKQLSEYLEQEGYLDTRPRVPEADALPRVMGALQGCLEAGEISENRIAELVASVYSFRE